MSAQLGYLERMGVAVWRLRSNDDDARVVEEAEVPVSLSPMAPTPDSAHVDLPIGYSAMSLEELAKTASDCCKCNLSRSRTTVVFGEGSPQANLMIIGEAPGEDEDIQGKPFVGKSGQLLDSILAALGLMRKDIYIANVLKCRPPMNRDPLPDEARACSAYLQRQLQLIKPSVIVALGRISAQLLLDTQRPLGQLRHERHEYRDTGIEVVVTYHPAYLLRRPTEKAKVWEDLRRVRELLANR